MKSPIKIGTRDSQLALWQANEVAGKLKAVGLDSELVKIKSEGDLNITSPLDKVGSVGIFTKALDLALNENKCDLAVHSCKDLPTTMEDNLIISAYLPRGSYMDTLVYKGDTKFLEDPNSKPVIATGSIRRKAQWLNRYPFSTIENLRGNLNTRLGKLNQNQWQGAIFAKTGLERINLLPENSIDLFWMIPAPAQGVIAVVSKKDDQEINKITAKLNHKETEITSKIERDFLRILEGGCSAPISILAIINNHKVNVTGSVLSLDGQQKVDIELVESVKDYTAIGQMAATEILSLGAGRILKEIELNG